MAVAIAFLSGLEPSAVSCFMFRNPKFHQNLARTFRIWLRCRHSAPLFANLPRVHPNNAAKRHSLRWPQSTWLIYDCSAGGDMPCAHIDEPRTVCMASAPLGAIAPNKQMHPVTVRSVGACGGSGSDLGSRMHFQKLLPMTNRNRQAGLTNADARRLR